ncbi:MAG: leucyl aminopeptidase [Deltaproteobacteria bacterium]|nr:leucyl aminopeptidase [Deltaproteobacteria bacterium]
MKILVKKGKFADFKTEALVLPHFEGETKLHGIAGELDRLCGGGIREMVKSGDFEGRLYQTAVVYIPGTGSARRIILVGLGKKKEFNREKLRGAFAKAAQRARDLKVKAIAVSVEAGEAGAALDVAEGVVTEAIVEGVTLGVYQFTPFKTLERENIRELRELTIVADREPALKAIRTAARNAEIIARAVYFARDIVSTPANELTPTMLARKAGEVFRKRNVRLKVLDVKQMQALGMNALLGVARGSDEPARFIIMEYQGAGKADKPVVLVGKGLTFDSGGICIKPPDKMDQMKSDMSGGAAVIGAMMAVSDLGLPVNVVGLVPATENLPGGRAYKPGDIFKSLSGRTIEVLNTDAEGRIILADALAYAGRYKPAAIVDVATLTGACVVALGEHVIGMMGTDEKLINLVRTAADTTGERAWELPLWEEYHELVKSDVADFKNAAGRGGGAITAAAFLSKFAGDYPWVHLDIAGPAWLEKDLPYIPKGASGVGVRLLVQFLRDWKMTP